jgi:archaellum component FlaF (FlaF/FlaG flagellin family)
MKSFYKILIVVLVLFLIGFTIAYKSMFSTYDKINKEQAIIEISNTSNVKIIESRFLR